MFCLRRYDPHYPSFRLPGLHLTWCTAGCRSSLSQRTRHRSSYSSSSSAHTFSTGPASTAPSCSWFSSPHHATGRTNVSSTSPRTGLRRGLYQRNSAPMAILPARHSIAHQCRVTPLSRPWWWLGPWTARRRHSVAWHSRSFRGDYRIGRSGQALVLAG